MGRQYFDAVVVGGGHAGTEAVFALSKLLKSVALVTLDKRKVAMMPCNPAIGGSAKGIITREIDALGGVQGLFSDQAMIQIKMLHENKGPAIHSLRAQVDKDRYSEIVLNEMERLANLTIFEDLVTDFEVDNEGRVISVILEGGTTLETQALLLTTGTYLDSKVLRGEEERSSGPDGQRTSNKLSDSLRAKGFELIRLKTGTPPRIYADSIDFSKVSREALSPRDLRFSHRSKVAPAEQVECYLTHTTEATKEIILANLHRSSIYSGQVKGVGPRYCPSIEDKIVNFQDKERHQIFFEPETASCETYYINGLSTSMPVEVQDRLVRSIPGLEGARVAKWGYAIEYDAIDPINLRPTLESKLIKNLYLAGQINGTSGYEEAAAQGLVAAINLAAKQLNLEPLILQRDEAYIGVLIDDLITKGVSEPYRMLTSRAEYRLLLRNDNVDERLHRIGYRYNLIPIETLRETEAKYQAIDSKIAQLRSEYLSPNSDLAKELGVRESVSLLNLILRPEVDYRRVVGGFAYLEELVVRARLEGYIKKQLRGAEKMRKMERLRLPEWIDYSKIHNLATEARQKLERFRPQTIGEASRISGINPSDIQMIMLYLNLRERGVRWID